MNGLGFGVSGGFFLVAWGQFEDGVVYELVAVLGECRAGKGKR